jgi:hypothetical protein
MVPVSKMLKQYREQVRKAREEGRCSECGNPLNYDGVSLEFEGDGPGPEGVCQDCGDEIILAVGGLIGESREEEAGQKIKASEVVYAFLRRIMKGEEEK